jgi:hypothetical protein
MNRAEANTGSTLSRRASTDNDVIDGGAGDDVITGGAGDDIVEGGDGIDTARFSGNARDYDISVVDGQLVVSDRIVDRDGTDHLEQLEFLQFADGTISAGDLLASLANSSGSQLQVLATDGDGNITGQLVRYADGSGLYSFQIAANLALSCRPIAIPCSKVPALKRRAIFLTFYNTLPAASAIG